MSQATKTKMVIFGVILAVILSLVVALCFVFVPMNNSKNEQELSNADNPIYTDEYGDWTYTTSGNNAYITRYSGSAENVVIPSTITDGTNSYTVKQLGTSAISGSGTFSSNGTIKTVVIPNTITLIGYYTFYSSSLISVNIPNSVTSIGRCAFWLCKSLETVVIGNGVKSIESQAFQGCSNLTSLVMGAGITSISHSAFSGLTSLTGVQYNGTIESWCKIQFDGSLGNPNPLITAHNLYINNELVTDVVIPSSVTSISAYAFHGASCLNSVTIHSKVTSIGERAFSYCSGLTEMVIPNSVTSIGKGTFAYCSNLANLTLSNNITGISYYLCQGCASLTTITIPENVTEIGSQAFDGCRKVTTINYNAINCEDLTDSATVFDEVGYSTSGVTLNIGENVQRIPAYLCYCPTSGSHTTKPKLTNLNWHPNCVVTSIGVCSLQSSSSMSVTIPESVTSIGSGAFITGNISNYRTYDNAKYIGNTTNPYKVCMINTSSSITSITFHDTTEIVYASAFSNCYSLNSITIPSSVKVIGDYAFYDCRGLTELVIPDDSIKIIGDSAFRYCSNLTSVVLGDSVEKIGNESFRNCSKLRYVYFRCSSFSNVSIGYDSKAFDTGGYYSSPSVSITYFFGDSASTSRAKQIHDSQVQNSSLNTSLFGKNGYTSFVTKTITYVDAQGWEYSFGDDVITIRGYQGDDIEVTIPTIINHKGYNYSVTSVQAPESYNLPRGSVFSSKITGVTIPGGITIGSQAFNQGSSFGSINLVSVTLLGNVTISANAFQYCYKLFEVINKSSMNITIGSTSNGYIGYYAKQIIREESQSKYQIINGVRYYIDNTQGYYIAMGSATNNLTNAVINNSCKEMVDYAFYGCTSLTSITIGNNIPTIGEMTFYNCTSLASVTIGAAVTSIGQYAFAYCNGLASVTIPNNVVSIDQYAVYYCSGLTSVAIGSGVVSIDKNAFNYCNALTSVYYTGSIGQWCNISFSNEYSNPLCYAQKLYINNQLVTDLVIPSTVTKVNQYTFYNCTGLTSVTIPDSVTSIGSYAFAYCNGLTSVTIGSSVTSIGSFAFYRCNSSTSMYFLHDYSSGVQTSSSNPNYIGSYAFTNGNSNVTYYFINQASRDNAYNLSNRSNYFTGSNFEVMTPQFIVKTNNSDWGSVTGNTNPDLNTNTTLTAVPNSGYVFKSWLKNGESFENNTSNSITVEYTEYVVYTAVFGTYCTITTNVSNNGYGTVTNGDTYLNGTEITLTATPNTGYAFVKWLKNNEEFVGNTENPLTIIVTEDTTYTAVFKPLYTITTSVNNSTYGSVTAGDTYVQDTSIILIAAQNYGYKFTKWQKDGQDFSGNTSASIKITVTADATYTAIFEKESYTLTTEVNNSNYGSVTSSNAYLYQDEVSLTATPSYGYKLAKWQKDGEDFENNATATISVTVTANATYTAIFEKTNFTITTGVNNSNYGSVTASNSYLYQAETSLIATPNYGYYFVKWQKDEQDFSGNTTATVNITVTANATYTAIFEKTSFTITTDVSDSAMGAVSVGGTYLYQTEITLTATPNEHCVFVNWLKNGESFEGNTSNPLSIAVTADDTYTAVFGERKFSVTIVNLTNDAGSVNVASGDYFENSQLTLTATPNTGAKFFYWLKDGVEFEHSMEQSFTTTVTEDVTYTVVFAPESYAIELHSPNSIILEYEYQGTETVNPEVCGRLTTYCYGDFDNKTTVRVEAIATTGYRFVGWKINGEDSISSKYTSNKTDILLTDIQNSKIVIAVFAKAE